MPTNKHNCKCASKTCVLTDRCTHSRDSSTMLDKSHDDPSWICYPQKAVRNCTNKRGQCGILSSIQELLKQARTWRAMLPAYTARISSRLQCNHTALKAPHALESPPWVSLREMAPLHHQMTRQQYSDIIYQVASLGFTGKARWCSILVYEWNHTKSTSVLPR